MALRLYDTARREVVPFDPLIKTPEDQEWLKGFYPAFMENSQTGGKTWGIPFQRSTIVLYYNKELFKEAGLDPDRPPGNGIFAVIASTAAANNGAIPYVVARVSWLALSNPVRGTRLGTAASLASTQRRAAAWASKVAIAAQPTTTPG